MRQDFKLTPPLSFGKEDTERGSGLFTPLIVQTNGLLVK